MRAIKTVLIMLCICLFILGLTSCKSKTVYIPVERVKAEYIDRIRVDSILKYDSIFQEKFLKGDTVYMLKEKYKYIDRVKLRIDSFSKVDSIYVPYPVKGDPIKYVSGFQSFQIWCGRILLLLLVVFIGFKFVRMRA